MWYPSFEYKFKATDANYIANLMNLFSDFPIKSIQVDGQPLLLESEKSLKDLSKILTSTKPADMQLDERQIKIITDKVPASLTIRTVFPRFKQDESYTRSPASHVDRELFATDIEIIKTEMLRTDYMRTDPVILQHVTNRESAWKLLNLVDEKIEVVYALDIPSVSRILLLSPNYAYVISYGQLNNVVATSYPAFDIDNGFFGFAGESDNQELKEAFKKWKDAGRTGVFFTDLECNPLPLIRQSAPTVNSQSRRPTITTQSFFTPSSQKEAKGWDFKNPSSGIILLACCIPIIGWAYLFFLLAQKITECCTSNNATESVVPKF